MTNQQYWQRYESFRRSRAKKWELVVRKALQDQVQQFIETRSVDLITGAAMQQVIRDLYMDVGVSWANATRIRLSEVKRYPMGFSQEIVDLMQQYFGDNFLNIAEGITQTTREEIGLVLVEAQQNGEGFDWITERVQRLLFTAVRARLIARTEVVAAANQAALIQADRYNFVVDKMWISVQDMRTRDGNPVSEANHRAMNGVTVPKDQPFIVSGELMMAPGDKGGINGRPPVSAGNVCNCRCTVAFVPRRDERGRLVIKQPTIEIAG
jgi:uncharacterized protein with gpF-like domain